MVDVAPSFAPEILDEAVGTPRARSSVLDFLRRQPLGTVGLALVLVMAVAGLGAEWIAPYSPTANDFASMTEPPSWAHIMGTDQFGRDLFSRIVYGARTAFIVGFCCAMVGGFAGLVLGVASAYFGGRLGLLLERINDVIMAFPLIILALAVIAVFGGGVFNVILAITIPLIPRCARVVRSSALAIREVPYIDASLSYLGLGVQEPIAAWGLMLQGGAEEYASTAPWIAIFPGVAIALTVFGFSLFGDALRDAIDPKLRDR